MAINTGNGIKANEKQTSDNMSYVYAENDKKEFVRIQKDVLKMILGIPTKLSELNNDKGFVDKMVNDLENYYLKSETYTRDEIDNKLSLVPRFSVKVVSTLPTEDISETTVYLVPSGEDEYSLYTEYINVDGLWEILGTQKYAFSGNASDVIYDDSETNLGADNVQGAIGKLSATVNDLKPVKTVNGKNPDENGNIEIEVSGTDVSINEVEISETEPSDKNVDIWINPTEDEEYHFYTAEEIDEMLVGMGGGSGEGSGNIDLSKYALKADIPTKLPNPNALIFTGAVTGTYDGSKALTLNIPSGGGSSEGASGSSWKTIGTQVMDGVESAVSFEMNGETIIQITILGDTQHTSPLNATQATVNIKTETNQLLKNPYYAFNLNSTQWSPKNVFLIFGNSTSRTMLVGKMEGVAYAETETKMLSSKLTDLVEDKIIELTITFDKPPCSGAVVNVEGM